MFFFLPPNWTVEKETVITFTIYVSFPIQQIMIQLMRETRRAARQRCLLAVPLCALRYLIRLMIPSTLLIHTLALQIRETANIVQLIAKFPMYCTLLLCACVYMCLTSFFRNSAARERIINI